MSKTLQDVINTISNQIEVNFNHTVSTDSSSPIGQLIGIFAASDLELYELAYAVESQFNLSLASGVNLDILAKLFLANRKAATKAKFVDLDITGTSNQTVTELQIEIVGLPNTYSLISTFTLDESGKAKASFAADIAGHESINSDISQITFQVLTSGSVVTIVAVDGSSSYVNGNALETDPVYRNRLQYSSSKNGTNMVDSVTGLLLQDQYVEKVIVYEFKMSYRFNPSGNTRVPTAAPAWLGSPVPTEKGVLGYFEPVVKLTATPNKDEIAQIIWNNNPPGIICAAGYPNDPNTGGGSTSGTAIDVMGESHTVFFTEAGAVTLTATIKLKQASQGSQVSHEAAIKNIQDTLIAYVETIPIAGIIRYSVAYCDIAGIKENVGYFIEEFTWGTGSTTTDIDLKDINGARSCFVSTASDISVTVVS